MAASSRLDQVVKGAPLPTAPKPPATPPLPLTAGTSTPSKTPTSDPFSNLPSSPPQIYLNLLILESSLRAQYLHLLSRRRLNTFFILLLAAWNSSFIYLLFLRPREDGTGYGGSVYWVVETLEKLALLGGLVTALLIWGTGQWERGIRWPRRWVGTANRGLRGFNLRVVVVRRLWWREMISHLAFLFPSALFGEAAHSDWHLVEQHIVNNEPRPSSRSGLHVSSNKTRDIMDEEGRPPSPSTASHAQLVEEDLAPGGDFIKLLLLPKSFSAEFRENWEEYRSEYWERENERRRLLRRRLNTMRRARARQTGGWRWWTGLWRLNPSTTSTSTSSGSGHAGKQGDKHHHLHHHSQRLTEKDISRAAAGGGSGGGPSLGAAGRRRSLLRSDSTSTQHSRQSSRSSTPHSETFFEGALTNAGGGDLLPRERARRGSSTTKRKGNRDKEKDRERVGLGERTASARNSLVISPLSRADSSDSIIGVGGGGSSSEGRDERGTSGRGRIGRSESSVGD